MYRQLQRRQLARAPRDRYQRYPRKETALQKETQYRKAARERRHLTSPIPAGLNKIKKRQRETVTSKSAKASAAAAAIHWLVAAQWYSPKERGVFAGVGLLLLIRSLGPHHGDTQSSVSLQRSSSSSSNSSSILGCRQQKETPQETHDPDSLFAVLLFRESRTP